MFANVLFFSSPVPSLRQMTWFSLSPPLPTVRISGLPRAQCTLYQQLVRNLGSVCSQFRELWHGMQFQPISETLLTQNCSNGFKDLFFYILHMTSHHHVTSVIGCWTMSILYFNVYQMTIVFTVLLYPTQHLPYRQVHRAAGGLGQRILK